MKKSYMINMTKAKVACMNNFHHISTASASPFSLDDESGTISVTQTLDPTDPRSTDGLYILSVTVRGGGSLSTTRKYSFYD